MRLVKVRSHGQPFEKMRRAAKVDKITLVAFSTYRSYAYQKALFEKYVARDGFEKASTYSAQPGKSEHQTGLGFDIGGADSSKYAKFSFSSTKEAKWLAANAHRYGFHLRYPLGKESWTGLHIRKLALPLCRSNTCGTAENDRINDGGILSTGTG